MTGGNKGDVSINNNLETDPALAHRMAEMSIAKALYDALSYTHYSTEIGRKDDIIKALEEWPSGYGIRLESVREQSSQVRVLSPPPDLWLCQIY